MPATLTESLVEWFAGDADLPTLVPSGVWLDQIPEAFELPFVALKIGVSNKQFMSGETYLEETAATFSAWAKGDTATANILAALESRFRAGTRPTLDDPERFVGIVPTAAQRPTAEELRATDDEVVFRADYTIKCILERVK